MIHIELAPEIDEDFERILQHLEKHEVENAVDRIRAVIAAISVLKTNPLIGRSVNHDMRELIIGRGSHGYAARYQYVVPINSVFVLAIRAQREAGYAHDE